MSDGKRTVELIIGEILENEGGFVDNPKDDGGATKFGITERTAREYGYQAQMVNLPRELARTIYRDWYYEKPGFDQVAQESVPVAAELTDTEVNLPPGTATEFLQRGLNCLNRQGKDWKDLAVDGEIGPKTCAALRGLLQRRADGEQRILTLMNAQQAVYYMERCEADPDNEAFMNGWLAHRVGVIQA